MKITGPEDLIEVKTCSMLIFGQPGSWKTSLAQTALAPFTLDFDNGIYRAFNRKRSGQPDNWMDVFAADVNAEFQRCRTIVVDTVGRLLDLLTVHVAQENTKNRTYSGNLTMQGWGALKYQFCSWMTKLKVLGKDVVLIAHEKEEKDGDLRYVRPDIQGGSYGEVMKVVDLVGYLRIQNGVRVLSFNPTDQWVGKNAAGWPDITVPSLTTAPQFLGRMLEDAKRIMSGIAETSKDTSSQVANWNARVAALGVSDAELDKWAIAVGEYKAMPKGPLKTQVGKLIKTRMLTLDLESGNGKVTRKAVSPDELPDITIPDEETT